MDKIMELAGLLADELLAVFPNSNTHHIYISDDGYIHIDSVKWEEIGQNTKRRYDCSVSRLDGEWMSNDADGMNQYLKTVDKYLEDESNEAVAS